MLPLVREGDPTRTLIDATRPLHGRTRVRIAARNVALALGWLVVAMYGLFLATVGIGGPAMTATAERVAAVLERYEAVIGIEIHCQLQDGLEDVLRLLDGLRRRGAQHPRLPGLPRPARGPAGDQPARGRVRDRDRPGDRGAASPSGRSGSARTTSTRTCPRATRSASTRSRSRRAGRLAIETSDGPFIGRTSRGRTSRRTRPSSSTATTPAPTAARTTLVDFNRSGAPLMEIVTEPEIRTAEQARRYAEELQLLHARDRRQRRRHGARPDARRGERVAAAARRRSRSGRGSRSRT